MAQPDRDFNGYSLDELRQIWVILYHEGRGKLNRVKRQLLTAGLFSETDGDERTYGKLQYTKYALVEVLEQWPAEKRTKEWTFADALTEDERKFITQGFPARPYRETVRKAKQARAVTTAINANPDVVRVNGWEVIELLKSIDAGMKQLLAR